jgi:hypothetical protein
MTSIYCAYNSIVTNILSYTQPGVVLLEFSFIFPFIMSKNVSNKIAHVTEEYVYINVTNAG